MYKTTMMQFVLLYNLKKNPIALTKYRIMQILIETDTKYNNNKLKNIVICLGIP